MCVWNFDVNSFAILSLHLSFIFLFIYILVIDNKKRLGLTLSNVREREAAYELICISTISKVLDLVSNDAQTNWPTKHEE